MKTIITLKNGAVNEFPDCAGSVEPESEQAVVLDMDMGLVATFEFVDVAKVETIL
jgi:hypothetical protein